MKSVLLKDFGSAMPAGGSVKADVIEAIADWCEALHGGQSLREAFAHLVRGLGAEAGMLVRTHLNEFRSSRIEMYDCRGDYSAYPLKATFADGHFGPHLARPRTASVWLGSAHEGEYGANPSPALGEWQAARRMKEFVVLVLCGGPTTRDHIELHFREQLSLEVQASLGAVVPTMARTWAARQVGLITRTAINKRLSSDLERPGTGMTTLLSISNPARLSRAEFRVCLLLSRGLSTLGVSAELCLSEATVRSHLRNIYAKTETSGLPELVFMLLGARRPPNEAEARWA